VALAIATMQILPLPAAAALDEDGLLDAALGELNRLERRFESKRRTVLEEVPFFSLNLPLSEFTRQGSGTDDQDLVTFRFFEPRYVMMAAEIERGNQIYGYVDRYPPAVGGLGTLVNAKDHETTAAYQWLGPRPFGPVVVLGRPGPRFRIVSIKTRAASEGAEGQIAKLFLGKVSLLPEEEQAESASEGELTRRRLLASWLLNAGIAVEEEELEEPKGSEL